MTQQSYEDYWKLTVEYTDIHGDGFIETLRLITNFIDLHSEEEFTTELYRDFQSIVNKAYPKKDMASVRKSINQFVKLGFINYHLESYHINTKDFLDAESNKKRDTLFSKIVYSNAKFNSGVTKNHNWNQINFLIKTLIEIGKLSKEEIIALMLVDISTIKKGYINKKELNDYVALARKINFVERKYNQIGYLTNFLKKLNDVFFVKDELYFKENAKRIFGEELETPTRKRNPYMHLLYKNQLFEESELIYKNRRLCMLEKLEYPVLIASHIKPFIDSNENEAYDPNNGLLLSRTIDSLFDLKYISFSQEGEILFSNRIADDVKEFWKEYKLDSTILNEERKNYLVYHRNLMTEIDASA
jgi:hypothetical protein